MNASRNPVLGTSSGARSTWSPESADTLAQIVAPMDPRVFVEEYWGRRAVFIKGTPGKFRGLFDLAGFYKAVEGAALKTHVRSFRLSAVVASFDGAVSTTEPIGPDEIEATLAAGTTICVNDISLGDDRLSAICEQVKRRMNFTGWVRFNSYLSPHDSGTDTHFDTSVSTTLQIEGRKLWRYAERPAVPWPPSNAQLRNDGTPEWSLPWVGERAWEKLPPVRTEDFVEVTLEPGDVLSLPAGAWHSARAIGHSLALNLALAPANGFNLVKRMLEALFDSEEAWRSGPPPAYNSGCEAAVVPERVQEYFDARCREMAGRLSDPECRRKIVEDVWREIVNP